MQSLFNINMFKLICFILTVIGISYFCRVQTKGFRLQEILSDIPSNPKWEVLGVSPEAVKPKLKQKFRYLGSGEQSHAFLSEDRKTVLKFFRHNDLSVLKVMKKLPPDLQLRFWDFFKNYDPRQAFDSCKFAYEELKNETGLHYLHINKTSCEFGTVEIVDNGGVSHVVDLDRTEFMVQDYCELAVSRINSQMERGDLIGAKTTIIALFDAIEEWTRRGVRLENPILKKNIGFYGDKVIMLDVGSLKKTSEMNNPDHVKREIKHVTRGLGRWIDNHHPDLFPFYEEEIKNRS